MRVSNRRILILLSVAAVCWCSASANRLIDHFNDGPLLQFLHSPLYDPLAGVALHVGQIDSSIPAIKERLLDDEAHQKAFSFLVNRLNRLKPLIRHLMVTSASPPVKLPSSEASELQTVCGSLSDLLQQVHTAAGDLASMNSNPVILQPMQMLSENVQQALYHAAALKTGELPDSYRSQPVFERFILREYIPHGERIFMLKKGIESIGKSSNMGKVEDLINQWTTAHDRLDRSALRLLFLVNGLKQSERNANDLLSLRKLHALSSFLDASGDEGSSQGLDWDALNSRLDEAEASLLSMVHRKNPVVSKHKTKQQYTLPEAITMVHQIEAIIPRLRTLHEDLHSMEGKIRFFATRAQRASKVSNHGTTMEHNNSIRTQLNRLMSDVRKYHSKLRSHMADCLIKDADTPVPDIDFMSPLMRFAQLETHIKSSHHPQRFEAELKEMRSKLRNLHHDGARLHHFRQVLSKNNSPPSPAHLEEADSEM